MKKTLLFIAVFALTIGNIFANPVDAQRAQQIGQSFLSTAKGAQKLDIQLVHTSATRGDVDYYVFNVSGDNGFVVVAGDDRVKPILAYSTTGRFNPNDIADGFEFTLNSFCEEIQYVRDNNLAVTPDIKAEWTSVASTGKINQDRATRAVVGPLCQTIWNQNYPWNSQCPEDAEGSGGHVYAGCVATAMAQVMKFYDWPPMGTGSHTYNPDGYAQQTANFGETEYHFELMPNELDSLSTEEDYFYIAQFQHHCGIAVDMQYGGNGSGAYSEDVPSALRNYFRYNCDDHITNDNWWGQSYTNEEWIQMLKEGGLDENIPLYYSGQDDNWQGGHAFVCDGYDENDYFHFNWGWSGRDDAWCPIGALNTTKYAFNMMNGFTGHIIPNSPEYLNRPENITDFEVVENADMTSVRISWTNPETDQNGEPLTSCTVTVYRNRELIYTTESNKGQRMDFVDEGLEAGLYQYSIVAENEFGFNKKVYTHILVGDKCDVVFELTDDGGNGWKGAAISVTDEKGQRIAIITMTEGSEQTVVMPLLTGNINFIWNHGWYHNSEGYDTDYECHFTIYDANGTELYVSGDLSDGVFLTHDNNCEDAVEETAATSDFRLYPNPTDGIVTIEGEGSMTISVLNILGQKIMETEATDNANIDLSVLEAGIYMVRIETVNGTKVEKINKR
ncbi:MAG: C10 family peptidase [Bacteroidales bacterium]|nr:C10 family peptidase [Bacteroidales bacterium]